MKDEYKSGYTQALKDFEPIVEKLKALLLQKAPESLEMGAVGLVLGLSMGLVPWCYRK